MVKINNFLLHFCRIIYWKCPAEKPWDGISETLNFKIFWGACPQIPLVASAFGAYEKFILERKSLKSHATPLIHTMCMSQLESAGGTIVTTPTKLFELTELSQFPAYYVESDMLTN